MPLDFLAFWQTREFRPRDLTNWKVFFFLERGKFLGVYVEPQFPIPLLILFWDVNPKICRWTVLRFNCVRLLNLDAAWLLGFADKPFTLFLHDFYEFESRFFSPQGRGGFHCMLGAPVFHRMIFPNWIAVFHLKGCGFFMCVWGFGYPHRASDFKFRCEQNNMSMDFCFALNIWWGDDLFGFLRIWKSDFFLGGLVFSMYTWRLDMPLRASNGLLQCESEISMNFSFFLSV